MSDITIKIREGTGRSTGESLCKSCRYSTIWMDRRGEHVSCRQMSKGESVRGKVMECNSYYNKNLPSLDDLYQTAWTLRTEKDGRKIGFTPPRRGIPPEGFDD